MSAQGVGEHMINVHYYYGVGEECLGDTRQGVCSLSSRL